MSEIEDAYNDGYSRGVQDSPHPSPTYIPASSLFSPYTSEGQQIRDAYNDGYSRGLRSPSYISPLSSSAGNSEDIPPSQHGFSPSRFPPSPEEIRRTKVIAWVALAIILLLPLMICGLLFASIQLSGIPGM